MEGSHENIHSGDESEKKNKKSSVDLEDLEAEKKKKMKTSLEDEKADDLDQDVKMNNSSDDDDDDDEELYPVLNSSGDELTDSEMVEYNEYMTQMVSSGGFDIVRRPQLFPCNLFPLTNLKEEDEESLKLIRFSKRSIHHYNVHNGTSYKFVKFVKAVMAFCAGQKYYITFEAKEPSSDDAPTIFQSLVYQGIPIKDGDHFVQQVEVVLVRMKSAATEKDNQILLG